MTKARIVLYCLIIIIIAGIGFALVRHSPSGERETLTLESVIPKKSDVRLNRIHHVATRDGVEEWSLDAESARYEKAGGKTVFDGICATFFLEGGRAVTLNSEDGVLWTKTKDMEIWGNVVAQTGPYQLNTNRMRYDHKAKVLSTNTPVFIRGRGMEITGDGMTFDLQTEHVVVQGRVQAVMENFAL
jgi:LPS export ABC transporter protein LptC